MGRDEFADDAQLKEFVEKSDVIVHLAGIIKSSDADLREANVEIANRLSLAIKSAKREVFLIYASSVRIHDDTEYGRAKRAVGDFLKAFCTEHQIRYCEIVFPNLFGEFSKPYYNNVTGTFAARIANGEKPEIHDPEKVLPLLNYTEAADVIAEAIKNETTGRVQPEGIPITLQELADRLSSMNALYSKGVFPDLRDEFDLQLFNALRINLFPEKFPFPLVRHADERGSFFECIREHNGGQVSFSTTRPGIVRGNHFHFSKVERFLVLSGEAVIRVRKLFDSKTHEFRVSGDKPVFVDMPTLHTHNIENIGDCELLTLFWINEFFDPDNPDTYPVEV